jgi:hypothetical protein
VAGLHIWPSPIRPRARWERGARSPLAPTVPCSGTHDRQEALKASMYCLVAWEGEGVGEVRRRGRGRRTVRGGGR